MKTLLNILFLVSFFAFAQNDTIALQDNFLKKYDIAVANNSLLSEVDQAITLGQNLSKNTKDNINTSYYLATLYYLKGTEFNKKKSAFAGAKTRGFVNETDQVAALQKAKKLYQYFVQHYKKRNDFYRAAQTHILRIDTKLNKQ